MKVTVLKDGITTDYFFTPEHYQAAWDSYKKMQEDGEIQAFSIVVGGN
jgi:predicted transcriptional regulator